jgi:hypothetical protein
MLLPGWSFLSGGKKVDWAHEAKREIKVLVLPGLDGGRGLCEDGVD